MNNSQTNWLADLARHNELRALHGTDPLVLSQTITTGAQEYANQLIETLELTHSSEAIDGDYGENLYLVNAPLKANLEDQW